MKKEFIQKIKIPDGIELKLEKNKIEAKGPEGENSREFKISGLIFEKKNDEILIGSKKATKKEKRRINTMKAHINNIIKGVQKKFEYKLKVCFNHFPFTIEIKGNEATIKNFLGEKIPRKLTIPEGVEAKVEKDIIIIKSTNKELAGQAAANFETATKIRLRDRRVFQDGLFIIEKDGRTI